MKAKVVSVSRARDRRAKFEVEARRCGVEFEFYDAVDAKSMPYDELNALVDGVALRRNIGRQLCGPEIACAESHRRLYRELVNGAFPGLLIFEDDISFLDSIATVVAFLAENAASFASQSWIFHLGGLDGFEERALVLGQRVVHRVGEEVEFRRVLVSENAVQRTCGYYITREAAASILRKEPRICQVPDPWMWRKKMSILAEVWMSTPPVVRHPVDLSGSMLEAERAQLESSPLKVDIRPYWRRCLSHARAEARRWTRSRVIYPLIGRFG